MIMFNKRSTDIVLTPIRQPNLDTMALCRFEGGLKPALQRDRAFAAVRGAPVDARAGRVTLREALKQGITGAMKACKTI